MLYDFITFEQREIEREREREKERSDREEREGEIQNHSAKHFYIYLLN